MWIAFFGAIMIVLWVVFLAYFLYLSWGLFKEKKVVAVLGAAYACAVIWASVAHLWTEWIVPCINLPFWSYCY